MLLPFDSCEHGCTNIQHRPFKPLGSVPPLLDEGLPHRCGRKAAVPRCPDALAHLHGGTCRNPMAFLPTLTLIWDCWAGVCVAFNQHVPVSLSSRDSPGVTCCNSTSLTLISIPASDHYPPLPRPLARPVLSGFCSARPKWSQARSLRDGAHTPLSYPGSRALKPWASPSLSCLASKMECTHICFVCLLVIIKWTVL